MADSSMHKVVVSAPLNFEAAAMLEVAKVLGLPPEKDRQPDLQYLTAIFVSSGQNKNGAVFLGSELVKARNSIVNKAMDVEHEEQTIIGQIISSAFVDRDGKIFDAERASRDLSVEEMDAREMDIAIAAVVHKTRFPDIASEIRDGVWMVSMEAFYRDYDVKVGEMIIPRAQAEERGYDQLVGSVVQLKNGKEELGFHLVGRVLRDIVFAGVGIVKNPANPRSVIMEAAAEREYVENNKGGAPVVDLFEVKAVLDGTPRPVEAVVDETRETLIEDIRKVISEELQSLREGNTVPEERLAFDSSEVAEIHIQYILPGTCVNYKRYVAEMPGPATDALPEPSTDLTRYPLTTQPGTDAYPPGTRIVREHYCGLFGIDCSSRPGDATHPECWRNVFARTVKEEIDSYEQVLRRRRVQVGLARLQELLDETEDLD